MCGRMRRTPGSPGNVLACPQEGDSGIAVNWKSAVGAGVAALAFLAVAMLVYEARKPPPAPGKGDGRAPLTDVARANQRPLEGPMSAPVALPSGSAAQPEAVPAEVIPPDEMPDPAHPPRWTAPLAEPGAPVPPDPFTPPPMVVDPDRGRRVDAGP